MALMLIRQHGLVGWQFRFDHARRRFGCCKPALKLITLSRPLTLLNPEEQVRDTILHEIAHALTPGNGHGARWRSKCKELGAKPARCYTDATVVSPPRQAARYEFGCRACGWWVDRRRVTWRHAVCKRCRTPVVYREKLTGRVFQLDVARGRGVPLEPA